MRGVLVLVVVVAACGTSNSGGDDPDGGNQQGPFDGSPGDGSTGDTDGGQSDAAAAGEKIIFVTSSTQSGNFGGLAGADDLCATRASDAGLQGTFLAWLSTDADPVGERLAQSTGPYVRTDGAQIAADWADLTDGSIDVPINRDEDGNQVGGDVWTGTLAAGTTAPAICSGWDTTASTGRCGDSGSTDSSWTDNITPPCTTNLRLYCVQQ